MFTPSQLNAKTRLSEGFHPGQITASPQIGHERPRRAGFDDRPGEVDPGAAPIQNARIGGGDRIVRGGQKRVGIGDDFGRPVGRDASDHGGQAPAVGNRGVEQPQTRADAPLRQPTRRKFKRREGFLNPPISPMHPGQVSKTSVAPSQNDAPAERRFQSQDQIKPVNPNRPPPNRLDLQPPRPAIPKRLVRTRRPNHGHALPLDQPIPIPHQL